LLVACLYPMGYIGVSLEIQCFADAQIHLLVDFRTRHACKGGNCTAGSLGDVKSVGGQVSEMRIDVGAGYRVYFTARDGVVIVLLAGGDKSSQSVDIQLARKLAKEI